MKKEIPAFAAAMHDLDYDLPYRSLLTRPASLIQPFDRPCEKLDGTWRFCVDPYETGMRKKWFQQKTVNAAGERVPIDFDFDHWEKMEVPSCWNLAKKEYLYYEGTAWYTRTFPYTAAQAQERVFLMFEGAQYECRVWLNEQYIARHLGGSTPFSVEITQHLQQNNRIVVMVNNQRKPENLPAMNTDWFNYGGLYRSVAIYRLPKTFIRDAFVRLVPNGSYRHIAASVEVDGDASECLLKIPELQIAQAVPLHNGRGEICFEAEPTLWCPENPKLYRVMISCGEDRVEESIGFKEIKTEGRKILLNGKPVFLRGISHHEDHPTSGKTICPAQVEQFFSCAKELNCNFVRLAHYPHTRYAARLADRLGMLLWEEIPVYWAIDYHNPATHECARNQMTELILRDRNRVSVSIWSVGNETPDTDPRQLFMKSLIDCCRSLDGTRPVSAACLVNYENFVIEDRLVQEIDIIGINEYFGWYRGNMQQLQDELDNVCFEKPLIVTELGAGALAGHHGTKDEFFTEERQAHFYEEQMSTLLSRRNIVGGMTPWILFDFRSPGRTNTFQRGYNRKGLMNEDCTQRKQAFYVLQKHYRRLLEEEDVSKV